MDALNKGYVPDEIRDQHKGDISVGLEDKRGETLAPPPPPAYTAYSGEGTSLGGTTGQGLGVDTNVEKPKFDANKPATKI